MDRTGDQTDETVLLHVVVTTSVPLSDRAFYILLLSVGGREERAPSVPTSYIPSFLLCASSCLTSFEVLFLRTGTRSGKNTISFKKHDFLQTHTKL